MLLSVTVQVRVSESWAIVNERIRREKTVSIGATVVKSSIASTIREDWLTSHFSLIAVGASRGSLRRREEAASNLES